MHRYNPPQEFLEALHNGIEPASEAYFASLAEWKLEWRWTSEQPGNSQGLRFERVNGELQRVQVEMRIFLDES
jgi:hypothetical protein